MKYFQTILTFVFITNILTAQPVDLSKSYGPLFDSVQLNNIFNDQKTFVDCVPLKPLDTIKAEFNAQVLNKDFELKAFVASNFDTTFTDTSQLLNHLHNLWNYLSRNPTGTIPNAGTLIPLPEPFIVPGGRFREIYYWDSYFTMLGLKESGQTALMKSMLNNFAYLIEKYGHIPNGNRTYYLSRSQPPFFSFMVELYANMQAGETLKQQVLTHFRPFLLKEYEFWMDGKKELSGNNAYRRIVKLDDGSLLNRYWDDLCVPRPESFQQDITLKKLSGRDSVIFRDIRAAAESGWDFSSRWFGDKSDPCSIQTTQIIPVDLNALLYHLELLLSQSSVDKSKRKYFLDLASKRKAAMIKYCWDDELQCFTDYNFSQKQSTKNESLAMMYPLFVGLASEQQAALTAQKVKEQFLFDGGAVTTLLKTGEQWDAPNGWAPLQWITICSLKQYGFKQLAEETAWRWINLNTKVYFQTNKMMEKYDVVNTDKKGGGGEYPLQDGFGWTNGVFLTLWNELHEY